VSAEPADFPKRRREDRQKLEEARLLLPLGELASITRSKNTWFSARHYLFLIFCLPFVYEGEALGFRQYFLTYPLRVIWSPEDLTGRFARISYVLIYGTLVYMVAGIPVGFVILGFRRLFKWLNDEKWLNYS
jgi:hypothetical protein